MGINFQGGGMTSDSFTPDKLLVSMDDLTAKQVTLAQNTSATDVTMVRGRLLNLAPDTSKYHAVDFLDAGAVTVLLTAATEVVSNAIGTSATDIVGVLAHPPIPGTVHVATTADGSGTVKKELGYDNGLGVGVGADGSFTVDYETGVIHAHLTAATSAGTDDLKAGYQYLVVDAATSGKTLSAMPKLVLAEDITAAAIIAGDVVTVAYETGMFNSGALKGYVAGYLDYLERRGIQVRSIQN